MIDRHKKDRRERSVEARKVRLGSGARGELAKKLTGIGNVGFVGGAADVFWVLFIIFLSSYLSTFFVYFSFCPS